MQKLEDSIAHLIGNGIPTLSETQELMREDLRVVVHGLPTQWYFVGQAQRTSWSRSYRLTTECRDSSNHLS